MRPSLLAFALAALTLFTPLLTAQAPAHPPAHPSVSTPHPSSASSAAMPGAIRECEGPQCGVWVFQGNKGQAMWQGGAIADLTVEKFDGRAFLISRADPVGSVSSPYGINGHFTARYVGTINGDRIDGTVTFNGNERDVRPWFATIPATLCSAAQECPVTTDQLVQLGENSFNANLHASAMRSFMTAANLGNADGQGFAAYVLYKEGPRARQAEGFKLAQASAASNSTMGMIALAYMYQDGIGTSADPVSAKYWTDRWQAKVTAEKHAQEQQKDRANVQKALMLAIIMSFMGSSDGSSSHSKPGVYGYSGEGPVEKQQNQEDWHDRGGDGSAPDGWHQGGDIPGKDN